MALELMAIADFSPEVTPVKSQHDPSELDISENKKSTTSSINDTDCDRKQENTASDNQMITEAMIDMEQNKLHKYVTNFLFWIRMLVLILTIFLFK